MLTMLPGPEETWEMRAEKHPERLQSFLVAVAEQPNYFADVMLAALLLV